MDDLGVPLFLETPIFFKKNKSEDLTESDLFPVSFWRFIGFPAFRSTQPLHDMAKPFGGKLRRMAHTPTLRVAPERRQGSPLARIFKKLQLSVF